MNGLREFFNSTAGKITGIVIAAVALLVFVFAFRGAFGKSDAGRLSRDRIFIDAENGKAFNYEIKAGTMIPVKSPFSGKETGYEAELCFWTKDGKPKDEPTPVLLNSRVGKPEPTFCPDCGRLVTAQNNPALIGAKPPPTQQEYKQRGMKPRD